MKIRFGKLAVFFAVCLIGLTGAARSDEILRLSFTVNGAVESKVFTKNDLQLLPQIEVATANDYVDGTPVFQGPLLRDVVALAGLGNPATIRLIAVNDYSVTMPFDDALTYDVILAMTQDSKALSRRSKGPIWVIYPMSAHEELQEPSYNARLVWQLVEIELLE